MAATQTFPTTPPSPGTRQRNKTNAVIANLGDGYEQRTQVGINSTKQVWSVVFTGLNITDATEIKDFLEARKWVVEPFLWTPPGESQGQYRLVPETWDWQPYAALQMVDIRMEFIQVFDL